MWNPGDGSDVVDGQDGFDTLQFNGANISEKMTISAKNGHAILTRDVGAVSMDLDHVERIAITARGGADNIVVNDLSKTDVQQVAIDLAGTPGSGVGDGQADTVTVTGIAGSNHISVVNNNGSIVVTGLPAQVTIDGAEAANDTLAINTFGSNDTIDASASFINVVVDAGAGNDIITGGQGNDTLSGGDGNDTVTGGRGNDVASLGNGNDTFVWNPGDGSDIVEGQGGTDTLVFNGANIDEIFDISANGSRARLSRNVGAVVMDLGGIEQIRLAALGGADTITVNDLSGTDVKQVTVDLAAVAGSGQADGQADTVIVNGSAGVDQIKVVSSGAAVSINGLAAQVTVNGAGVTDSLIVNGGLGADNIDASLLVAGKVNLTINGGDGDDHIVGSAGNDFVIGGRGNDTAQLGAGDDTFVWNPGDGSDTVEGQGGNDTLIFNGANINEKIDLSANGSRVRLSRDVAAIVMDVNGVETLNVNTLGGADLITVNDLTGTGVHNVNIDLGSNGAPDGFEDTVVINATSGSDAITVTTNNGIVTVSGAGAADVTISNFDTTDHIVIHGLGGDDVIDASGLSGMLLMADGGDGDDVLVGSHGNDTLIGGLGDDVLIGNGGIDILDGGPGGNVILTSPTIAPQSTAAPDGSTAGNAALLGQFMASSFAPAAIAQTGMTISEAAASPQAMLAQPHA